MPQLAVNVNIIRWLWSKEVWSADTDAYNDSDVFTFRNGCHAAEVEIDAETGAVTLERYKAIDEHRASDPRTHGCDRQSGQLLSGSFTDYALPRADWLKTRAFP